MTSIFAILLYIASSSLSGLKWQVLLWAIGVFGGLWVLLIDCLLIRYIRRYDGDDDTLDDVAAKITEEDAAARQGQNQ